MLPASSVTLEISQYAIGQVGFDQAFDRSVLTDNAAQDRVDPKRLPARASAPPPDTYFASPMLAQADNGPVEGGHHSGVPLVNSSQPQQADFRLLMRWLNTDSAMETALPADDSAQPPDRRC